jgi:hypothetical protein
MWAWESISFLRLKLENRNWKLVAEMRAPARAELAT